MVKLKTSISWNDIGKMAAQLLIFLGSTWACIYFFVNSFDTEWVMGITICLVLSIARFLGIDPVGTFTQIMKK